MLVTLLLPIGKSPVMGVWPSLETDWLIPAAMSAAVSFQSSDVAGVPFTAGYQELFNKLNAPAPFLGISSSFQVVRYDPAMPNFAIALMLKPLVLFLGLGVLLCVRYAVIWWFPEGKIKRLLLWRV
jgi:hypothetical protein